MPNRHPTVRSRSIPSAIFPLLALYAAIVFNGPAQAESGSKAQPSQRAPTGQCGSGDLLSANGFEDPPDYAINFLSDANTVFTGSGQQFTFEIEFVDDNGVALDTSDLEWCLEDDSLLSVAPNGLSANVASTGFQLGSVDLVVRDRRSGIENTATVAFADLAAGTVYLDSDFVESTVRGSDLVLSRNAVTEGIQVGDVLVSGDKAGILERVLTVSVTSTQVILTTEPAALTDAFDELDISASSPTFRANFRYSEPDGRLTVFTRGANGLPQRASFTLGSLECQTAGGVDYPLTVTDGALDWDADSSIDATLRISGGTVLLFQIINRATLTLNASTGSLELGSSLSGAVSCEVPLPSFDTPEVPVSVFSIGLSAQPTLGVNLDGSISSPSFSLTGPKGTVTGGVESGIRYTSAGGWEPVAEPIIDATASGFEARFDTEFTYSLGAKAFGGLGFDLVGNLGRGIFGVELARLQFAELNADVTFDGQLRTPLDPMDKDYTGPNWSLAANANGTFKAELTGRLLANLLERIGVTVNVQIDNAEIFDPVVVPLAGSPQLNSIDLSCQPESCNLDIGGGDNLTVQVMTDGERSGQVDYVVSKDGSPTLTGLTAAELFLSNSLGEWAPKSAADDGDYRLYLRVESDPLSAILPYALPTAPEHRFTVGPVAQLTVEKVELVTGTPISSGFVTSMPAGIDCGLDCQHTYTSGSLVTLTVEAGNGWQFVQWANDSEACPGSTDSQCDLSLTIDQVVKAELALLTDQHIRDHMVGTWVVNNDVWVYSPTTIVQANPCSEVVNNVPYGDDFINIRLNSPSWGYRLRPDGTGTRFGIDVDTETCNASWGADIEEVTWQVSNGIWSVSHSEWNILDYSGEITELIAAYENYEFIRWLSGYGVRNRMYKQ